MSDPALVLVDDADGVRSLVLNRPAQLNAFDQALCKAFADALQEAGADDSVRVVVVTGAGRAFSSGTDLVELEAQGDFRGTHDDPGRFDRLVDALTGFPKPLVCAVNGVAVGIGVTMLGLADLVVIADTARLRCPFTSLSLVPEAGASVTFPMLLGRQGAAWVLMSSEWIDARQAQAIGLAWKVVPQNDVLSVALADAQRFAQHPLESLLACKRLLSATFGPAIAEARNREDVEFDVLLRTPETQAAVSEFTYGRRGAEPGSR